MSATECSVEGCDTAPVTRNNPYCNKHYLRFRKYGDPLGAAPKRGITSPLIRARRNGEALPACCGRAQGLVTSAEGGLSRAARIAARNPTERHVADVMAARETLRAQRLTFDEHMAACTAGQNGGAS